MLDVMFYEVFKEEEQLIKKFLPTRIRAGFTWKTIQGKNDKHPPSKLISIRTQSRIPQGWATQMQGILTRSQGYDHLIKSSTPCGYLPSYCSRAVAEQAIMMVMALKRKLKTQLRQFECFNRDGLTGQECLDSKLLVVGVGEIGSQIVDIARGLKMQVKGVDICRTLKNFDYVPLSKGVSWAEVVICALPLTASTNGMFSLKLFKKAKPGLIFVNISRGEISPSHDLKKALTKGIVAGLGLDVYEEENMLAQYLRARGKDKKRLKQNYAIILELMRRDQVLFTPHNAFNTYEASKRKAQESVTAVIKFLKYGRFPDPIPQP